MGGISAPLFLCGAGAVEEDRRFGIVDGVGVVDRVLSTVLEGYWGGREGG